MIAAKGLELAAGSFRSASLDFELERGAYAVLMGSSGCGKTTLLETLTGLRSPSRGQVLLDGRDATQLDPAERQVGYVPQDGALFRTMTVEQHLGFGLSLRGAPRGEVRARARSLADQLGLGSLLGRRPRHLSGGERQRVNLGRALCTRPAVLILDEPLSALDEETRLDMTDLLRSVHQDLGGTVLHVTHDPREAARLATQVLRMDPDGIRALAAAPEMPFPESPNPERSQA